MIVDCRLTQVVKCDLKYNYQLVSIRKRGIVILSEAKNLCGPINYEILRRPPEAGLLRMTPKATVFGSRQAKELTP